MQDVKNLTLGGKSVTRLTGLALGVPLILAGMVGHVRSAEPTGDFTGVWLNVSPTSTLSTADGSPIPFNAAGKIAMAKAKAGLKSGKQTDAVKRYCLPEGVPRLMQAAYPMQIVQSQSQVTILHESHHTFRIILIDGTHPAQDDILQSYMGDSIGRWSGKELIVDTLGFNASEPLDSVGLPHGEKLHITETFSRKASDGNLVDLITIEDPEFYAKPFTVKAQFNLRPDLTIEEYVCGEPHRKIAPGVKP